MNLGSGGGKPVKPSFVSYVTPEEIDLEKDAPRNEKCLDLLPGEVVFCSAAKVLKYIEDDLSQHGIFGTLLCTNFRVSFAKDKVSLEEMVQLFRNKLYGENDIPLSCVDNIYGVYEDKKKLVTGALVKNRYPSKIIIHSKDLRVSQFVLTFCKEEDAKRIFQGIVHHCLEPKSLKNIFAFSYCKKTDFSGGQDACFGGLSPPLPIPTAGQAVEHFSGKRGQLRTMMFDSADDWAEDMKRTKGSCRVVIANANFDLSSCLPRFFIVPANVSEVDMSLFQGRGLPIWCWSHHSGCALFKTASLPLPQEDNFQHSYMEKMLTAVAHNYLFSVKTEDLSDTLPTVQDIQLSYNKFKQFFLIDNTTDFWVSDMKWFSLLENCGWLDIIRQCLQKAMEVVECLEKENTNVLIIEEGGSDLCCIISSLVQLMLDPFYRTLTGFQSLVQKEWVAGGHRFLDRCNHLHLKDKENVSPVFLLFLECVWQLFQQYGPAFQFSETYLTVLSDSVHVPVFCTFLFNSDHHRASILRVDSSLSQRHPLNFQTVWDWSVQFDCKSQALFINPLYTEKPKQDKSVRKSHRSKHQRQLSLPNSAFKTSSKKGFFKDEADSLKKMLAVKRISRWMLSPDSPQPSSMSREFYNAWQRKPLDYHGLLLPCLDGPSVRVWMQRYLRWIHEVQIFGGGSVTVLDKVSGLLGEVQELQRKLDCHGCRLVTNHQETRLKGLTTQSDARSLLHLSSSFPFTTLRNYWSYRPSIPTSLHSLMASGNLETQENDDQDSIV